LNLSSLKGTLASANRVRIIMLTLNLLIDSLLFSSLFVSLAYFLELGLVHVIVISDDWTDPFLAPQNPFYKLDHKRTYKGKLSGLNKLYVHLFDWPVGWWAFKGFFELCILLF